MADHKNTSHGSSHKFKKTKREKFDSSSDSKGFLPSFHISSSDLPEVKDWEVGQNYEINLLVKQVGKREDDDGKISGDFDIIAIKSEGKSVTPEQKKAMEDMGV